MHIVPWHGSLSLPPESGWRLSTLENRVHENAYPSSHYPYHRRTLRIARDFHRGHHACRIAVLPCPRCGLLLSSGRGYRSGGQTLHAAQTQVLMQAYAFTSAPIAKALVEAHKRGVKVLAVLDKSNEIDQYSAATFLNNAGIQPLIDDKHAIAHAKVMVIDSATIMTGSFNFTKAAEEKNAENLLVITDAPELVKAYEANIPRHASPAHPYQRQAAAVSSGTTPVMGSGNEAVHGN
jgi:phosphatidylserine/phosphatidylglycerophosphate/cardiolipin synthase-like enzyme